MPAPKNNKHALGNTGGRPSKFKDEYCEQGFRLALLGATDKEIAAFFGVTDRALNSWKKIHIEFFQSLKRGKLQADAEVAKSLYKRAIGYDYDEVTFEKIDGKINLELTTSGEMTTEDAYKKKVVTKEVVPDVTAQIFWLKNRQKDKWRDRHDLNGSIEITKTLEAMTDKELDALALKMIELHNKGVKKIPNK